jgi:hypothetical protein
MASTAINLFRKAQSAANASPDEFPLTKKIAQTFGAFRRK